MTDFALESIYKRTGCLDKKSWRMAFQAPSVQSPAGYSVGALNGLIDGIVGQNAYESFFMGQNMSIISIREWRKDF